MASLYLKRYAYPTQLIEHPPSQNLGLVITIPCFNEPDLLSSLEALHLCDKPSCDVEVIVIINQPKNCLTEISRQNQATCQEAKSWADNVSTKNPQIHIFYIDDLPDKHAGVGLARKIAMDEAVRRFEAINNPNGIIACFDADSTCRPNYLTSLERHFRSNPKTPGCSIHFEHPLDRENREAIICYELFLRYYVHALRYAEFPYAYQTIGSSMAVRSWAYQKQGGMNRRKAGEDFYFLHRIIPLGHFTELKTTRVIPSPRLSDRVPFGTGRAMMDWQEGKKDLSLFYNPQLFEDLKALFTRIEEFYPAGMPSIPKAMQDFLATTDFNVQLDRMRQQSTSLGTFKQHFFQWFDGLKVLKYVHYARDHFYPQVSLPTALSWLSEVTSEEIPTEPTAGLLKLRELDQVE